jgi:maleate isomerase
MAPRITPADRAIGTILPSSNRVVERATAAILAPFPDIDACFTRISYHGHGNGQPADAYDLPSFLAAGDLLAHAGVGVVCWNGTRGAALGFTPDRELCDRLSQRTGLPAVTTALATLDLLKAMGPRGVAIVSQGTDAEGAVIVEQFRKHDIDIVAERHLGITDNFAAARTPPSRLAEHVADMVRTNDADAILIWSTNLPGHAIADALEESLGIPVLDSAAIGVRASLQVGFGVGVAPRNGR